MVHRTTFYAHFDDKLALLRYAVDELQKYFEPVDPSLDPRTGPREYFMVLFHNALSFLKSHRGMFLTVQGAAEFYVLDEIITDALKQKLSESAPAAGFDPELTARFYAGGLLCPDPLVALQRCRRSRRSAASACRALHSSTRAPGLERRNPTHVTNIKL